MDNFKFEQLQQRAEELYRETIQRQYKDDIPIYGDTPYTKPKKVAKVTKVKENYNTTTNAKKDKRETKMKKFTEAERYYLSFEDLTDEQRQYLKNGQWKKFYESRAQKEAEKHKVENYYKKQKEEKNMNNQVKKPSELTKKIAAAVLGALVAITIPTGMNKTTIYHKAQINEAVEASKMQDNEGERIK